MKKFKFIPLFCGLLFAGNSSSASCSCPNIEVTSSSSMCYSIGIYVDPRSEDDFYSEYFDDLKDSKKLDNGRDFAFYSQKQEAELKRLICREPFLSIFELGNVDKKGTLQDSFIISAMENVKNDIEEIKSKNHTDNNDREIEYIHEKGCSSRKFILDMALDQGTTFYIKMSRMFLAVPSEDKYTQIMNNIFGESEYFSDVKNDIISTFVDYYCTRKFYSFLCKGNIDFEFTLKKLKKRHSDLEFNESVYESSSGGQMLLLILLPKSDLDVISDSFIEFCKRDFEKKGKLKSKNNFDFDGDNIYQQWLTLLEDYKEKFIVGLSKIYIYCPLPDGYFEKAHELIEKLAMQLASEQGLLYKGLGYLSCRMARKLLY